MNLILKTLRQDFSTLQQSKTQGFALFSISLKCPSPPYVEGETWMALVLTSNSHVIKIREDNNRNHSPLEWTAIFKLNNNNNCKIWKRQPSLSTFPKMVYTKPVIIGSDCCLFHSIIYNLQALSSSFSSLLNILRDSVVSPYEIYPRFIFPLLTSYVCSVIHFF